MRRPPKRDGISRANPLIRVVIPAIGCRFPALGAALACAGLLAAPLAPAAGLTAGDLATIYAQAEGSAEQLATGLVIAVVDRDGRALLVRQAGSSQPPSAARGAIAVSKAGTAVFLSSGGEA